MSWTLLTGTGQRPGHYLVYERGVPDIVLQHEKCIGHSVKVPGKCPLTGMDINPWAIAQGAVPTETLLMPDFFLKAYFT